MPPPDDDVVVAAWLRVGEREPEAIEPVGSRRSKKSVLFRLVGAGERGRPVVAKLCRGPHATAERRVYEDVLPTLRIPLPLFYGSLETPEGIWLFMEDGGEVQCDPRDPAHRELAGRWLAGLHGAGIGHAALALPDRGPDHHLERLRSGRRAMLDNRDNPVFEDAHLEVLDSFIRVCDELETRWHEIEELSDLLPRTVVHGDFCRKNLHVRSGAGGLEFFPLDWEMAGWGLPACDLCPTRKAARSTICDLDVYGEAIRAHWPALDRSLLRRAVALGGVFRNLCGLDWASVDLPHRWPEKPIPRLKVYSDDLAIALRDRTWAA
jgi:hypothetical protein